MLCDSCNEPMELSKEKVFVPDVGIILVPVWECGYCGDVKFITDEAELNEFVSLYEESMDSNDGTEKYY